VDGLTDGLIDDPRACRFDPVRDVPACQAGADADNCLTAAQAETLKKVYSGPTRNGKPFLFSFVPGSEANWANAIVPAQPGGTPTDFNLAQGVMKYLVFDPPRPDYDFMTFDYERDPALVSRWSKLADAKDPDLATFRQRGGKLIMTYGWADQVLQPMMGVNYYEAVTARNGRGTPDFARLFMMPGVAHCAGGVGPDRYDAVTAVIDWVEKGTAPASMVASKVTDGKVVRTRPSVRIRRSRATKARGA
jgi:feruloyl esterase